MTKFPIDAPKEKVIKTFGTLEFRLIFLKHTKRFDGSFQIAQEESK
jgi:hypothetical protein